MKKTVILISGKIKSGKNEAAKILQNYFEENGLTVIQDYFAKALKEYCKEDFKILANALNDYAKDLFNGIFDFADRNDLEGSKELEEIYSEINQLKIKDENWFEDKTFITRAILQVVGTQIFRNRVNDNYWVNLLKEKCEKSQSDIICIHDVRFPNEVYGMFSEKYNIVTVRLLRDPNKGKSTHTSETALDNFECWNHIIDNRRNSLKSFEKQIRSVGEEILNNMKEEVEINYSNNVLEPHKDVENILKII